MLKPYFLSKVAELISADLEFERLLLRVRGFYTMFRLMTVHGVGLLYPIPGSGC